MKVDFVFKGSEKKTLHLQR